MNLRTYMTILVSLLALTSLQTASCQNLPEKPLLNFVSVDMSDQTVILNWNPSATPNILYYKIYSLDIKAQPVIGTYIDSVPAIVHQYKHDTDPTKPLIYTVTAVDAVGESVLSGDYHRSVKVTSSYDSCSREMKIEWEEYIGWGSNISGYRVLSKKGFDTITEIAILKEDILEYTDTDIEENKNYEYVIEAIDNRGRSSFSNTRTYFTFMPPPPSFINLDYVSVLDDQTVEISFSTDLGGEINDFQLMKSTANQVHFSSLATLMNVSQSPLSINDQLPTQGVRAYYRIEALNSCLAPVLASNTASNIVLSGEVDGTTIQLNWESYDGFQGGVEEYEIYRMNEFHEFEQVTSAEAGAVSYIEDLSVAGVGKQKGEIFYKIVAVEGNGNPNGIKGRSASNLLKLNVETQLFVPNAFSPNDDGMNDTFEPVMDFIPSKYRMLIYDRSGKMLFQTTDPYLGWDGRLNGSAKARQGVYIYHIEYTSYSGSRKVLTGNLSLVNP